MAVAALRFLFLTGMRKSGALHLRWKDVEIERGCLRLRASKTGAEVVQFGASAVARLAPMSRVSESPWLFPGSDSMKSLVTIRRVWEAVRHATGLGDVRLHDLRHSFAAMAASDGSSLLATGALLGHKRAETTKC